MQSAAFPLLLKHSSIEGFGSNEPLACPLHSMDGMSWPLTQRANMSWRTVAPLGASLRTHCLPNSNSRPGTVITLRAYLRRVYSVKDSVIMHPGLCRAVSGIQMVLGVECNDRKYHVLHRPQKMFWVEFCCRTILEAVAADLMEKLLQLRLAWWLIALCWRGWRLVSPALTWTHSSLGPANTLHFILFVFKYQVPDSLRKVDFWEYRCLWGNKICVYL